MTEKDKAILISFVTRPGMYIRPVAIDTIFSFITGYEIGRKGECDFYDQIKRFLLTKHNVKYTSDGFFGQIERYSKRRHIKPEIAFRNIALEILLKENTSRSIRKLLLIVKSAIITLISQIDGEYYSISDDNWQDEWRSLVLLKTVSFRLIWTTKQLSSIEKIDKIIRVRNFKNTLNNKLTPKITKDIQKLFD